LGAFTLTGTQLATMFGANDGGSQFNPNGNQLVTITGLAPFTEIPEPSTWAMMVLGFAGLGYAAFRRNSKARAVAI
jgi:PEP-CTERM motif